MPAPQLDAGVLKRKLAGVMLAMKYWYALIDTFDRISGWAISKMPKDTICDQCGLPFLTSPAALHYVGWVVPAFHDAGDCDVSDADLTS
jgi:hypothetical protein